MIRRSAIVWCGVTAMLVASCDLLTGPSGWVIRFAVSDPTATVGAGSSLVAPGSVGAATMAYVALAPGSVPDGVGASVRNPATMAVVTTTVVDGGLDPVGIAAMPGDTVEISVWSEAGVQLAALGAEIPAKRRPVVIRTSPPRGKRDVVLNSVVVVVFSEPIDRRTVGPNGLRLVRGEAVVAGRVELMPDGLSARFWPDEVLAPNARYTIEVTTAIADVEGDPLEGPVTSWFETGTRTADIASLVVEPNPLRSLPYSDASPWGARFMLRASLRDAGGEEVTYGGSVQWRTSDADVVDLGMSLYQGDPEAMARPGSAPGTAMITATAGGHTATAAVVLESVPFDAYTEGDNGFRCLLGNGGAPYCVGGNRMGELGLGFAGDLHTEIPVRLAGDLAFEALSAGSEFACGLTAAGHAYCWGNNASGQLGDGTMAPYRASPTPVAGDLAFREIGTGLAHACALAESGRVHCWGAFHWGQGIGIIGRSPVPVGGDEMFTRIAVGSIHACALNAAGAAYCWGGNQGRLGDGSLHNSFTPVAVAGGYAFVAIAASGMHTCGITPTGEVHCWGLGGGGLSESGTAPVPVPVDLPAGIDLVELTAGWMLTCGLTAEGAAYCWGWTWPCDACEEVAIPPTRIDDALYRSLSVGKMGVRACGVTTAGDVRCRYARELVP